MPKLNRILETALYVDDLERARQFYSRALELEPMFESSTLSAYDVNGQSVLLIFKRGASLEKQVFSGTPDSPQGEIPPHDGAGPLHMCFAIAADQLSAWEARLSEHNVEIEGRTRWPRGGESIYFRDPDHHLLELITPGSWPSY
jgi:catechol 2,3-dioxygenase-like lactoylglutathione lyase family enzyme